MGANYGFTAEQVRWDFEMRDLIVIDRAAAARLQRQEERL